MKEVSLSGSLRAGVGTKDATAVRNSGRIPCVVYGSGNQTHFSVMQLDMERLVFTPHVSIVNLDIEGKKSKAIIQDIQFHPVTDKIHHVDFLELNDSKKVKVDVPVKLTGRSVGVMAGGKLQQVFRKMKVHALPKDLPDAITIDITNMKVGDAVRVKELNTDAVQILTPQNAVVVSVKQARGVVEEAPAAGAAAAPAAAAKPAADKAKK
ncbi:MAG: 50S ribosomal protein L25/general stress protein Ctc [Crocinitomicaceae bacterium]|nr:50S ribosomal protein L25/general stress protein Ctc [Crocinitomicaceae bacterium]MBK8927627.1 50S ribosomal protein L25/general stress protein Ctc [Crocinitomicaceae bacterium]